MEIFMSYTERRDDDRTSTEVCFKTMTKYWDLNFFTVYSLHSCESQSVLREPSNRPITSISHRRNEESKQCFSD